MDPFHIRRGFTPEIEHRRVVRRNESDRRDVIKVEQRRELKERRQIFNVDVGLHAGDHRPRKPREARNDRGWGGLGCDCLE